MIKLVYGTRIAQMVKMLVLGKEGLNWQIFILIALESA